MTITAYRLSNGKLTLNPLPSMIDVAISFTLKDGATIDGVGQERRIAFGGQTYSIERAIAKGIATRQ